MFIFGIDVGGTSIKLGLFSGKGDLIESWQIRTRKEAEENVKRHHVLEDSAESMLAKCRQHGIATSDIIGVGIDVPGPVQDDGTILRAVNLGWGVFNVRKEFQEETGVENVVVTNDANAAALGEMWRGGGRGFKNLVMMTIGTGIGGGLILDGKIVNGSNGAAGEIGHMKMDETEKEACGCGGHGCLEQFVAAPGIVRMAKKKLAADDRPSMLREAKNLTPREVFAGAKIGDPVSLELVEEFGDMFGHACSLIASVVNPEAFVIGGGVSAAGKIVTDVIQKNYQRRVLPAMADTKFCLAELGNDAGIYGAAKSALG